MNELDERPPWRVGRIAGLVTFVWVLVWGGAIAVLGFDRRSYSTLVRGSGNIVVRVLLGVVVFAAVLHAVDGIGRLLHADHERTRAVAWFFAIAIGVPSLAMLVWPFIEGRW